MTAQPDTGAQDAVGSGRRWWTLAVTPVLRQAVLRLAVPVDAPPVRACPGCGAASRLDGSGGSVLLPVGRCGRCGTRAGAPPFLLEAVTVGVAVLAVVTAPTLAVAAAALWWSGFAVVLVFVDLRVHRLPDVLTVPAGGGVVLAYAIEGAVTGRWGHLVDALLAAAGTGVVFLLAALLPGRRGMGLGDVKLGVSIALLLGWWGWGAVFAGLFLGFAAAGVAGVILLATRRARRGEHIPLGPYFIAGAWLALVLLALLDAAGTR